jgi:hypothetical protein
VQVLLKGLQNRAYKLLTLLIKKAADLAVFLFKNPIKSIFFIIKLYILLVVLLICLTASFSTFAQENIPAKVTTSALGKVVFDPQQFRGQSFADPAGLYCNFYNNYTSSGIIYNLSCSNNFTNPDRSIVTYSGTKTIGTSTTPHSGTITFDGYSPAGTTTTYSCPPDNYPNHTLRTGTGSAMVCNEPYVAPPLEHVNCVAYAGAEAIYGSFQSSIQKTPAQLDSIKCIDNLGDGGGQYANSCHIVGFGGWLESEVLDPDTFQPTGAYKYAPINGTISGYDCDTNGNPTDPDETCTAYDNGRIKSVTCPDGTSMSVNWGSYLDAADAVNNNITGVTARVQNLEDTQVTTNDIVLELTTNQAFKDSVKGADGINGTNGAAGEGCSAVRDVNAGHAIITCGGANSYVNDGLAGAKGVKGDDGLDGQNCTSIVVAGGVNIVCPDSTSFLAKGVNGTSGTDGLQGISGEAGLDGDDCTTVNDGQNLIVTCGGSSATLEGVDEDGIVGAIQAQTLTLNESLNYQGTLPSVSTDLTEGLNAALGAANDYEVRNYGTVMEAAVNEMKNGALYTSVEAFFAVSINGSCPVYSTTIPFMNTSVTLDQWCQPVMDNIWPMIQAVILLVFSYFGFREAIL